MRKEEVFVIDYNMLKLNFLRVAIKMQNFMAMENRHTLKQ
jgi:hypothetical protein